MESQVSLPSGHYKIMGQEAFQKDPMNKSQRVPIMKQVLEGTRKIIDFQVVLSFALG